MNDEFRWSIAALMALSFGVAGALGGAFLGYNANRGIQLDRVEKEAVEHGFARCNPKTGKFEWIIEEMP